MKPTIKELIGGGAKLVALSILLVNSALADSTSDARIQAYKANRLLSQEIVLPTSTGAKDSDEVVVFSASKLSWSSCISYQVAIDALVSKYDEWNMQELLDSMGPAYDWGDETGWASKSNSDPDLQKNAEEILQYLSLLANGKATSESNTAEAAKAQLQDALYEYTNLGSVGTSVAFPCEGLDFSELSLFECNLSNATGVTSEQILSAWDISGAKLPAIAFSGTENFAGISLYSTDLSSCTGITSDQIMSADTLLEVKLPAIKFDGTEDFSGKYLGGADFSKCTGITSEQILSADVMPAKLPAIAFTGNENLTDKDFSGIDMSKCTGITAEQIMSTSEMPSALPSVSFTGTENFSGRNLSYIDLTQCTGITSAQIVSASAINGAKLPEIAFNGTENFSGKKFGWDKIK